MMDATEYLKRPYSRLVVPEPDGSFRAEIVEFPGCIALEDSATKALESLEEVATSWIEAARAQGQRIPEPLEENKFSGKLVLRLPRNLHRKAARCAARDGISLNQFIVAAVAEQTGMSTLTTRNVAQNIAVNIYPMLVSTRDPTKWRDINTGNNSVHITWKQQNA